MITERHKSSLQINCVPVAATNSKQLSNLSRKFLNYLNYSSNLICHPRKWNDFFQNSKAGWQNIVQYFSPESRLQFRLKFPLFCCSCASWVVNAKFGLCSKKLPMKTCSPTQGPSNMASFSAWLWLGIELCLSGDVLRGHFVILSKISINFMELNV